MDAGQNAAGVEGAVQGRRVQRRGSSSATAVVLLLSSHGTRCLSNELSLQALAIAIHTLPHHTRHHFIAVQSPLLLSLHPPPALVTFPLPSPPSPQISFVRAPLLPAAAAAVPFAAACFAL